MDFHKGLSATVEDVKRAHIADEAVQSKYGVIYHQFWVNEKEGTVFCLMEGPDKESCAAVHREAHGGVACLIMEVEVGFYKLFMGEGHRVEQGLVKMPNGKPDTGIRSILAISIQGLTTLTKQSQYLSLKIPYKAKDCVLSIFSQYRGRQVASPNDDSLIAVFDGSTDAVQCALHAQKELDKKRGMTENHEWDIVFRMGVSTGQPLTEEGDFFSEATTLARRLCSVAKNSELVISTRVQDCCNLDELIRDIDSNQRTRTLTPREEIFITELYSISEEKLSDENFTVDSLSRNIGMSRPQLYRKIVSLTGMSPNDFIRDLRMSKALSLIRKKAGNICEIAMEVGYNNPSYFAKCFQMRYGCSPSRLPN
jgi:AraC-like DNA-binding protein